MASLSKLRFNRPGEGGASADEGSPWLSALPFPAALLDRDGTIREVNEGWLAAPEATLAGQSYLSFCQRLASSRPDAGAALGAGIRAVLSGRQRQFQLDYPVGAGSDGCCFRASVTPYADDSFAGALILCREVPVGGVPVDDADRRQSQKMETVGRLASGVAHDFANLLTLITGYSDLLLNRISQIDPLRPELDEIRKAATRGSRLTAQLLGFSRSQSLEPRVLDLNAVVSDMLRMLEPVIGEHIELETDLGSNLGRVLADPGQLEQVIVNLILNARDAMPVGGTVTIETENCEAGPSHAAAHGIEPGPGILLAVTDNGEGMDEGTMSRLFQPFFTTKEPGKGTGLGLSTVYGIVRRHRGGVWACSQVGHGSTFSVWLPQAAPEHEPVESVAPPAPAAGAGTGTILLVEDEENVRRLLAHVLVRRGYQVIEASNGEEAVALFNRQTAAIDLLLTDLVMPQMTGRELAGRLQQVRPDLRVVYMSGYTGDVLVRTGALSRGMSFIQKPLRPDVLAAKVREALDAPVYQAAASR
jgi:two-component system, cell cycle sensor histidine kinase and response regulator CckA